MTAWPYVRLRRSIARVHSWQPFMPRFYFSWLWDVPFVVVCTGFAVFGRGNGFEVTFICLLAASTVLQGKYEADRRSRKRVPPGVA